MRTTLRRYLLLTVSLLVSAAILEIGVLAILGERVKFPRRVVGAPFGVRINQPNAQYGHSSADVSVSFRINGKGLRADREYAFEKPEGVRRIVAIGDSYTVGFEVEGHETFSSVLEAELRKRGHNVEVLNAGVSGYGSAEACVYLERELLRYDPDIVLISFFGNDLVDNLRSNLYALENGKLREANQSYVPAGRLGNFLNTNSLMNFLSEYSNAFAAGKETLTNLVKQHLVSANIEVLSAAESKEQVAIDRADYARTLTAAIYERLHTITAERGIPLVIQSIPTRRFNPLRLVEVFPLDAFPVDREDVGFFAAKTVLDPWTGRRQLYHDHSQDHWTPFAHELAGQALADLIEAEGWLRTSEIKSAAAL